MSENRLKEKFEERYELIKSSLEMNKKMIITHIENEFMEEADSCLIKLKRLVREKRLLREIKESCQFN